MMIGHTRSRYHASLDPGRCPDETRQDPRGPQVGVPPANRTVHALGTGGMGAATGGIAPIREDSPNPDRGATAQTRETVVFQDVRPLRRGVLRPGVDRHL